MVNFTNTREISRNHATQLVPQVLTIGKAVPSQTHVVATSGCRRFGVIVLCTGVFLCVCVRFVVVAFFFRGGGEG